VTDPQKPPSYVTPGARSGLPVAWLAALIVIVLGALAVFAIFALNIGPFAPAATASAAPSNAPAATAGQSAQPAATASTPAGSDASPVASASSSTPATIAPSPGTPEEALLFHVPSDIRPTCTVEPGKGHVILAASCSADAGNITLVYSQYDAIEAMAQDFDDLRLASQIEAGTGNCEDHATWPAEGPYMAADQLAGRRLCTDQPGAPTIYWTDDRLAILSQASQQSADYERLVDFWANEAGPIP